jgi:hypothetical protein
MRREGLERESINATPDRRSGTLKGARPRQVFLVILGLVVLLFVVLSEVDTETDAAPSGPPAGLIEPQTGGPHIVPNS